MALDSGQLVNLFIIAQDYKTTNTLTFGSEFEYHYTNDTNVNYGFQLVMSLWYCI